MLQTKEVTLKVSQEATPTQTKTIASTIPSSAWLVLAVGIVGFLLLVGLRIYKSKRVVIDTPKVDIVCDGDIKIDKQPPTV